MAKGQQAHFALDTGQGAIASRRQSQEGWQHGLWLTEPDPTRAKATAVTAPNANQPEIRLVVSATPRREGRLNWLPWPEVAEPSWPGLADQVAQHPTAWGWTLSGGEPTLRADLPDLVRALVDADAPRPGLATDGLALLGPGVAASLARAGLTRIRVPLHSARSDAHDWLVGQRGAARRVRKVIQACATEGLVVEADVAVTRSTATHLAETVGLLAALGAKVVHLHRPRLDGMDRTRIVEISPRLGLTQPHLEQAVRAGRRAGLRIQLHGFPTCAAPAVASHHAPAEQEQWVVPPDPDWDAFRTHLTPQFVAGCAACTDACSGAPADYLAPFGDNEFASEGAPEAPAMPTEGLPLAPGRQGWKPATRSLITYRRALTGPLQGSPVAPVPRVEVHLRAGESSRVARVRLLSAAQERPECLVLVGHWANHEIGYELLLETRFFLCQVHLVGPIDGLAGLSDRKLSRLACINRFAATEASESPPKARENTVSVISRLNALGISARIAVENERVQPSDKTA